MDADGHEPPEPSLDSLEALDDAQPRGGLLRAQMRAALSAKLFGVAAEPARIGRFVILGRLGQGGMGDVYSAYDPKLDRRVALKLLRVDSSQSGKSARDRLEREAVALARLSHPNVVPVHDVGVIATDGDSNKEQMYIVMELVEGQTLAAWVEAEKRSWREIVDAYRQAGRGLAAAHAVGLVHRDFKPHNVQVGKDGRIRVLDFGLARSAVSLPDGEKPVDPSAAVVRVGNPNTTEAMLADTVEQHASEKADEKPKTESTSSGVLETPITQTGAILGTPAYMSPEQFSGQEAGPASDQFSFCVSLFEALYGMRPHAGTGFLEIAENTLAGRLVLQPKSSNIPGWLYPILTRGLSTDPGARYPSMEALLDELGYDPARVRRRRVLSGLIVALVAAVVGLSVRTFTAEERINDPCSGGREMLTGVFDGTERARLAGIFQGIDHPYAKHVWPQLADRLDQYASQWVNMHEQACRVHQRGEQSDKLLDRRMGCLERRRSALGSAVSVLGETNPKSLSGVVDLVQKLPDIDRCADTAALLAEVQPPENAEVARHVDEIRALASRAQALSDAGRYGHAMEVLEPLVTRAEPLGYRPALAELLVLQGQLSWSLHDGDSAKKTLQKAAELGLSSGMDDLGIESIARLIYTEGVTAGGEGALARLSLFEALAERIPKQSFARALLYNNAGVVYRARQESELAREYFERALAARAPHDGRVELALIRYNLMLVTKDEKRRGELLRQTLAEIEQLLGPGHPRALNQRVISAPHVSAPNEALEMLEPACARYEALHPELRVERGKCLRLLADVQVELGRYELAAKRYKEAAELLDSGRDDDMNRAFGTISLGFAALYRGDAPGAITILGPLLAGFTQLEAHRKSPLSWWEQQPIATTALGLGLAYLEKKEPESAVTPLEKACSILERLLEQAPSVARRQQLARARTALAKALCPDEDAAKDCARAKTLEKEARSWYEQAGPGYEHHLR